MSSSSEKRYIPYQSYSYSGCPENKILNPTTNRCVLKTGKIGKKILESNKSKVKSEVKSKVKSNDCPENKILNPVTNRCVLKSGKIGRKLYLSDSKNIDKSDYIKTKVKSKDCPSNKIINPVTNRCVLKTGKIGRELLNYTPTKTIVIEKYIDNKNSNKFTLPKGKARIKDLNMVGYPDITMAGFLYLMKKFKNDCAVLADYNLFENPPHKLLYGEDYMLSYDGDSGKIVSPKGFWKAVKKCKGKRFLFMPFYITCESVGIFHINMLIYDSKYKSLERFEPHGSGIADGCMSDVPDEEIIKQFKRNIGDNFIREYYRPLDFCPIAGIQYIQDYEMFMNQYDPGGFCSTWSLWYANLRLANPDRTRKEVIQRSISTIKESDITFTNFIRNYSSGMLHFYYDLLESKDPDKTFIKYSKLFSD